MRRNLFFVTSIAERYGSGFAGLGELPRQLGYCPAMLVTFASGYGGTEIGEQLATQHECPFFPVPPAVDERSFVDGLYGAIHGYSAQLYGNLHGKIQRIVDELKARPRPAIFLDDADRMARKPTILDLVRYVSDMSATPAIFQGGRDIRAALVQTRASKSASSLLDPLRGRICIDLELPAPILADAALIASQGCEVRIEQDLVAHVFAEHGESVASLIAEFSHVEQVAMRLELTSIDRGHWLNLIEKAKTRKAPRKRVATTQAIEMESEPRSAVA